MSDAAVRRKRRPGPGQWGLFWAPGCSGPVPAPGDLPLLPCFGWRRPWVCIWPPGPLAWLTLAAALCAIAIGIPAATLVERESGRQDPGHVVIDEVAGQWIALIHSRVNLSHLLAGFLFFRLFDIVKPWPARQLEGLPAGWGIMLDDVAAGVYALLLMQALQHWIG